MMKIGVIGTGRIAHQNVTALLKTGRAEIVALCNRTPEKAAAFAQEYGLSLPIFADHREMLKKISMDAALINTPHNQHCQQFLDCCAHGLHVMTEKPLATSLLDCLAMREAAQKASVHAVVCHTQRYLPPMLTLRRLLGGETRKRLGQLMHMSDTVNLHYFTPDRPQWFFDSAHGGLVFNHGAHQIDRIHFLTGMRVEKAVAVLEPMPGYPGVEGGYQGMGWLCKDHAKATVLFQCAGYELPQESRVEMVFEHGAVRLSWKDNGLDSVGVWLSNGDDIFHAVPVDQPDADPYLTQFNALLDALEGKPSDAPTLDEAADIVRVLTGDAFAMPTV